MLTDFKIGTRLSFGFGIILVLMMIVGGYSLKVINISVPTFNQTITDVYS
jgi:CHASE3 domain sensor protein